MERRGRRPLRLSARMASRPPSTPTVPSYMPAWGMASMCEPVATAGRSGSVPVQRKKVLPTASSRMVRPSAAARDLSQARARRSSGVKTTAGDGGAVGGGFDGGEGGEGIEFVEQAGCVDLNLRRRCVLWICDVGSALRAS